MSDLKLSIEVRPPVERQTLWGIYLVGSPGGNRGTWDNLRWEVGEVKLGLAENESAANVIAAAWRAAFAAMQPLTEIAGMGYCIGHNDVAYLNTFATNRCLSYDDDPQHTPCRLVRLYIKEEQ